jgi:fructose-1,6-bisphosphatase II
MTSATLTCQTKRERPSGETPATQETAATYTLTDTRLIQFDFLRATEMAALNCLPWIGQGDKESADAAACDAIRGIFDLMDMRGEIVIGEGIKDEAPGLFAGERVGRWRVGTPRVDIAIDPLDGTTNLSKGLPNSISCIAAAIRHDEQIPALQFVPAFYMKKLAYPSAVRQAWIKDSSLPLDINAPLKEVIELTARLLGKRVRDVVVMALDRPRNAATIDEVRSVGAQLRMIVDGDIAAALGPAIPRSGVDLYAGIGGAPEGILAAAGLRCMGGGMQAQMWPRDEQERTSLAECGWSDRTEKVYRSRDLVHSNDVLFIATGISDSPLLRGAQTNGQSVVTHSVLMRQHSGSVRFVTTEHDLARRPLRLRSKFSRSDNAVVRHASSFDEAHDRSNNAHCLSHSTRIPKIDVSCLLLLGAPGSGKGTIGKALGALPGFTHCSSGDIIRAVVRRNFGSPDRWKEVTSGQLLSDDLLWTIFDEYFASYENRSHAVIENLLLLDGIPRSLSQVEELSKRVNVCGVLHFDCGGQEALVRRLAKRFSQSGRSDDASEEVIRTRLQVYNEQTLPLLKSYPDEVIHRIDASQPPESVLREVLSRLELFKSLNVQKRR